MPFFFLIIGLYFLIHAVIAQIINPTAELAISIGIPIEEANREIEIQPVTAETKISLNCNLKPCKLFCASH